MVVGTDGDGALLQGDRPRRHAACSSSVTNTAMPTQRSLPRHGGPFAVLASPAARCQTVTSVARIIPIVAPRRVTPDEIAGADVVISIGCDLSGLPAPRGVLARWDEVPAPSEDFTGADEAIRKRLIALVEGLARKRP